MTDKKGIVQIHGKEYMTVARRIELWHEDQKPGTDYSVETEVLNHNPVVVRATVKFKGRTYTGISSVDLNSPKMIEKQNPYEVAETSAVGRALGFAGYGVIESIASADEVHRATTQAQPEQQTIEDTSSLGKCSICYATGKFHRKDCPNFGK
jgi:hypothetical protein